MDGGPADQLKLNEDKIGVILIGTQQQLDKVNIALLGDWSSTSANCTFCRSQPWFVV